VNHSPENLASFLGHFHPLLVHLPIGALVLLSFLEFVAWFTHWKNAAQNSHWLIGFVSATAVASAASGWILGQSGGYDAQLLNWHRALGLLLCATCLLTFLLRQFDKFRPYRISLVITLILLVIVSHLGGSMTHGRDFLTGHAPAFLRAPFGLVVHQPTDPIAVAPMQQPVFAGVIEPILQKRCSGCHGSEKHKADLRLDTLEGLLKGGRNGPVIDAGQAKDSPLMQRVSLPLDEDGHMPPEGNAQPTAEELALLEWWINAGTPVNQTLGDLKPALEIRRILEVVSKKSSTGLVPRVSAFSDKARN
jgi:uncharacterized membrane protein